MLECIAADSLEDETFQFEEEALKYRTKRLKDSQHLESLRSMLDEVLKGGNYLQIMKDFICEKNLQANIGDSINCTSLSISTK